MTLSEFSSHFEGKSLEEIKAEAAKEGFAVKADRRDAAIAELFAAVEAVEAKSHPPAAPPPAPAVDAPKAEDKPAPRPRKPPAAPSAPPVAPAQPAPVQYEGRSLTGGPFRKAGIVFEPGKWQDLGEVDEPTLAVFYKYAKAKHIAIRIKG